MKSHFLHRVVLGIFILTLVLASCSDDDATPITNGPSSDPIWAVDPTQVFSGGPGRDGIPSVDNPQFTNASEVNFLGDQSLVVGVKMGVDIKAYPHIILDWHEIVNDDADGAVYSIIYCPLTGTAMCWDRVINSSVTEFGVSGLLYQTNIIPYDRQTGSEWSQMLMQSIHGPNRNEPAKVYQTVETTWATWKKWFPNSMVMTRETGFDRAYGLYPYGDYKINNNKLIFPIDPIDTRLPLKERVHGIIVDDACKVYQLSKFDNGTTVINDVVNGIPVVVVGNQADNFIVSFQRTIDSTTLQFDLPSNTDTGGLMMDQEGNTWNVFGEAISGPRTGASLNNLASLMGYWMTFGSFYPQPEIYN